MNIHRDFDNKIFKSALVTFILTFLCILIPMAIISYAAENEIEVSQSVYDIVIGQTAQIDAYSSSGDTLIYASEDESICTVDENGLITAVAFGSTRICVSAQDGSAEPVYCEVNVKYPINIDDVEIFEIPYQTYKGVEVTPDIDAEYENYILVKDIDYTLTYTNNINAGTAEVIVNGIGNFTGEKTLEFTIYPADINYDVTVSVENVTYTGSAVTPDILAKIENYKLVLEKDYTLSYSNNVNIGTATITITGIGNVTGVRVVEFKIIPNANSLISYSNPKKTSLRLDWTSASGITGYKIYVYDSSAKKYVLKKTINDPNTLYCTVKGL